MGDVAWSGSGVLALSASSQISNFATGSLTVTDDQSVTDGDASGSSSFNNSGAFTETGAAGTLTIGVPWSNTGTVSVQSGTLSLPVGGSTSNATFTIASGATLPLLGGLDSLADGTTLDGDGLTMINGATVSIDGIVTATNIEFDSGTIQGDGTFTVTNLTWNGGTMIGAGTTVVTGTLTVEGNAVVDGFTLVNNGNATVAGVGSMAFEDGATLTNAGTWTLSDSGSLDLESGATFTNVGMLNLYGSGNLLLDDSILTNAGTLDWSGSGNLDLGSAATLTNDATLNWSGSGILYDGGTLVNDGDLTWSGSGSAVLYDYSKIQNQAGGIFDDVNDGNVGFYGYYWSIFENAGSFIKSGGTGSSTIASEFDNTGSVTVLSGTLDLESGAATGQFTVSSGATIAFPSLSTGSDASQVYSLGAGTTIGGDGLMAITGGTVSIDGPVSATNVELDSGTLTGTGDLSVQGTLTWTGGMIGGTGLINVAPGGFLDLAGGSDYTGIETINNEGTDISTEPGDVFVSTDNTFSDLSQLLSADLDSLQRYLDNTTFNNQIPLIGTQLSSGSTGQIISQIQSDLTSPVSGTHVLAIQQGLYDLFGPDGLNLLTDDYNDGGIDMGGVYVVNTGGQVSFQLTLHEDASLNTGQFGFTLGLPGLPFSVSDTSSVQAGVGFDLNLTFGVSQLAGQSDTPFVAPSTLAIEVNAGIPGMQIGGTLGFLQASIADDPSNPSSFTGTYNVAFAADPSNGLTATSSLTGSANVNLLVSANFGSGLFDPNLSFDFNLQWNFDNADTTQFPFGDVPSVAFNNVELDLGSLFDGFIAPLVQEIQQVTEPLEPIATLLTTPIPVLSDLTEYVGDGDFTFADLADYLDPGAGDAINAFAQAVETINALPTLSPSGAIELGGFTLTDPRQQDSGGDSTPSGIDQDNALDNVYQQIATTNPSAGSYLQSVSNFGDSSGLQFPILSNPTVAFQMLLGQNVTLFSFTLPPLSVSGQENIEFPLYPLPPISGVISGTVELSASATFAYDTSGLISGDPLDGFSINNATVAIDLGLSIGAGPGIPDVATLTLQGGVTGEVDFTLVDSQGNSTVTGSELAAGNFSVTVSGSLSGNFTIDLDVLDETIYDYELAEETFFTFGNG